VLAHRVLLRLSLLLPYSPPRNPSRAVRLLIQCCVPILHRAPSVAAPRSFLVVPTLARSVLRPRCYAPCLVPRPHRGAAGVLPTSPFTTWRSWPLLMSWPPWRAISAWRCCDESACCKNVFEVFQTFQRYVAIVLFECCKSRSGML
jgi:hypothetical protein